MPRRKIVGNLLKPNGLPVSFGFGYFYLTNTSYDNNSIYLTEKIPFYTNSEGNLISYDPRQGVTGEPGIFLTPNDSLDVPSKYICKVNNSAIEPFEFFLPSGIVPITLQVLIEDGSLGISNPSYESILSYVNNLVNSKIADKITVPFSYGDASPAIAVSNFSGIIYSCELIITQPFDGFNTLIKVGDSANDDSILNSQNLDISTTISYEVYPSIQYEILTDIFIRIDLGDGATQGKAILILGV